MLIKILFGVKFFENFKQLSACKATVKTKRSLYNFLLVSKGGFPPTPPPPPPPPLATGVGTHVQGFEEAAIFSVT